MSQGKNPHSGWRLFKKEFLNRTLSPFTQPSYVWYFLASMVAGTIGIWATIGEGLLNLPEGDPVSTVLSNDGTFRSILTFFTALGSASCARIVMIEDKAKHLRSFFGLLMLLFSVYAIVTFVVGTRDLPTAVDMAIIGSVLAMITWWMANWDEEAYEQEADAASLGGDPKKEAAGGTEDYKL